MDVEKIKTEDEDFHAYLVTIPERKKRIKVHVPPLSGWSLWEVAYEDGQPIPEIDSKFTTQKLAMDAVEKFSMETRKSEAAKHEEIFKDKPKEVPTLKTKKVKQVATEAKTDGTGDLFEGIDNRG